MNLTTAGLLNLIQSVAAELSQLLRRVALPDTTGWNIAFPKLVPLDIAVL